MAAAPTTATSAATAAFHEAKVRKRTRKKREAAIAPMTTKAPRIRTTARPASGGCFSWAGGVVVASGIPRVSPIHGKDFPAPAAAAGEPLLTRLARSPASSDFDAFGDETSAPMCPRQA